MIRLLKNSLVWLLIAALFGLTLTGCGTGGTSTTTTTTTVSVGTSANTTGTSATAETATSSSASTTTTTAPTAPPALPKSLKILAIGNSFSVDAMEYLWDICKSGGIETVVLGNLYIGGCSLDTHWSNIQNNKAGYTFYTNAIGSWDTSTVYTIEEALKEEDWDIITIQQASGSSGVQSTYGNLNNIVSYVDANKTNPDAKLYWHMTWAYQADSNHNEFGNYNRDQLTMYNAIVSAVQKKVLTNTAIDGVIPAGTAIQNLRTSYVGDTLTRDGYHLGYDHGRYIAGLTWFVALTGHAAEAVSFVPTRFPGISEDLDAIREAANNAAKTPYAVTDSSHTTE